MRVLDEFRSAAAGLGHHPQDHGWRALYRLFSHGLDRSAPNLTATVLAQHAARPTLSATHLLTLLGIALKAAAPEPFATITVDSPVDGRLDVLEGVLDQHHTGITEIIRTRQNSFTSARRFLVPQVLLGSYFARQDHQVKFADFGTGLGVLPRQLNAVDQYTAFAPDLTWPQGTPQFQPIPLAARLGADRGPLPDLEWVHACHGQSDYYAALYSELLTALRAPEVRSADVTFRELDLLNFAEVTEFIHQHKINVANLTYVLYELGRDQRSAIVELLSRELYPPGVLLVSEPHNELHSRGAVVEFFHNGQTTPETLCFVTDGHYRGYVLPLEDYESFVQRYPISYLLSRGPMKRSNRRSRKEQKVAYSEGFSLRRLMPPWLATSIGAAGTALGFASNLYANSFRNAITTVAEHGWLLILPLSSSVVASVSALLLYRWQLGRRQELIGMSQAELPIGPDALESTRDDHDVVVGRRLRYLEVKRSSEDLLVFVYGLGLDANDFRPYMAESGFHSIALTLFGFNAMEKDDAYYRPISLQSHVQLLSYALGKIVAMYPGKRITLVGFSFGADILLLLSQFSAQELKDLAVNRTVLLDPNVNHSTTTISAHIAAMDESQQPLSSLAEILDAAKTMGEFRNLCVYLNKITAKNFAQIQRHAKELIAELDGLGLYSRFLDRWGQLSAEAQRTYLVLSVDYEEHFNIIARGAKSRGMDIQGFSCSHESHFELIGVGVLKKIIEEALSDESAE